MSQSKAYRLILPGFGKQTAAILECYLRFRFWVTCRLQQVMLQIGLQISY